MTRGSRRVSKKSQEDKIEKGKGQGEGLDYQSFLIVQDVVGNPGRSSRGLGWVIERKVETLSGLELDCLYNIEWAYLIIIDIQEQSALLPLEETQLIAEQLEFEHPHIHVKQDDDTEGTRVDIVMTTDLVITCLINGETIKFARAVKEARELSDERVLEKLEIERRYWANRGIDWGIITRRDINEILARNVELIRNHFYLKDLVSRVHLERDEIYDIAVELTNVMLAGQTSLKIATKEVDERLFLPRGTSLNIAFFLVATRQWQVDMLTQAISPENPLVVRSASLMKPEDYVQDRSTTNEGE